MKIFLMIEKMKHGNMHKEKTDILCRKCRTVDVLNLIWSMSYFSS